MNVAVIEAGHDCARLRVNHLGVRALVCFQLRLSPHRDDLVAPHGDGLSGRRRGISRDEPAVVQIDPHGGGLGRRGIGTCRDNLGVINDCIRGLGSICCESTTGIKCDTTEK